MGHGLYAVGVVAIYLGADDPYAGDLSLPQHFPDDRKKLWLTQFDTDPLKPRLAGYRCRLRAHRRFLRLQLTDGRPVHDRQAAGAGRPPRWNP